MHSSASGCRSAGTTFHTSLPNSAYRVPLTEYVVSMIARLRHHVSMAGPLAGPWLVSPLCLTIGLADDVPSTSRDMERPRRSHAVRVPRQRQNFRSFACR